MKSLLIILLALFNEIGAGLIRQSRGQFIVVNKTGSQCSTTYVQEESELAFPTDPNKFEKIRHLWNLYYMCLEEKARQESKPEIHRIIAGQFIELKCDICIKPFQNLEEIEWKYRPLLPEYDMGELEHLDLTPQMELSGDRSLMIYNAIAEISGLYVCSHGNNTISAYILEVSNNDTMEKVDTLKTRDVAEAIYDNTVFRIYYKWGKWSECSACGTVGRKYKYGTCYVTESQEACLGVSNCLNRRDIKDYMDINIVRTFVSNNSCCTKNQNQTKGSAEHVEWLKEFLVRFQNGVPCFASYVTNLGLDRIQARPATRVAVQHCMEKCPESVIFEVHDACGNVIETANNSAGIFSVYQNIPTPPPNVDRRTIVANYGSTITIQCPSTTRENVPVTWKINHKIILPEVIASDSNGRITIDLVNRLHIKKLRMKDNRIYSCWQRNRLVGTINLNIEKKFKIGFNHHVTLLGLLILIIILLLVGARILQKELHARKHN